MSLPALPGAATASHAGEGGGQRDFAVGGGSNNNAQIGFAAHSGPAVGVPPTGTEPVTGHVRAKGEVLDTPIGPIGEFAFEGPVTCLRVEGNRTSFFYPFEHSEPDTFDGVFVFVEDNGPPVGGEPVDKSGFIGPFPRTEPRQPPQRVCPDPNTADYDTIEKGNFVVHDATP